MLDLFMGQIWGQSRWRGKGRKSSQRGNGGQIVGFVNHGEQLRFYSQCKGNLVGEGFEEESHKLTYIYKSSL